ncbi:MAG: hypothetical protein KDD77_07800, partial [Caldilineaceae bacterium]|nr:hypothetical protein [Caldilineaceae bacterium]
ARHMRHPMTTRLYTIQIDQQRHVDIVESSDDDQSLLLRTAIESWSGHIIDNPDIAAYARMAMAADASPPEETHS